MFVVQEGASVREARDALIFHRIVVIFHRIVVT